MWISTLSTYGLVAAIAAAAPSTHFTRKEYVIHEKRDVDLPDWQKQDRADHSARLAVRIGLTQQNLHRAEEFILDVSHPDSPNFGKHWSVDKVASMFAPSSETVDSVKTWLSNSGIEASRVKQSMGLSWLEFVGTVAEAEDLFQAEYYAYEHEDGSNHIACDSYSVPKEISKHVDIITPTMHFDMKLSPSSRRKQRLRSRGPPKAISTLVANDAPLPPDNPNNLTDCWQITTPACLRALYQFPNGSTANPLNSFGITEYGENTLYYEDLDTFFGQYNPSLVGVRPIFDPVDGGVILPASERDGIFYEEPPLDIEYGMILIDPQSVTLYQIGALADAANATYNTFLDAIDASYCTFEGGDQPGVDQIYPSTNPGGWNQSAQCGVYKPANVISTSYDSNEYQLSPAYMERQCLEYMKLGLQGVTILYSSGDYGVGSNYGSCIDPIIVGTHEEFGIFAPSFPSTCPWVTSVGATQIPPGGTVNDLEIAVQDDFKTGGGFSNVFPLPSYQAANVGSWWTNYPPPYNASVFNNSQNTRGYPDIVANGYEFSVAINDIFTLVDGTSASTPTVGAIITLINEERINAGKSPVGFLNPTLYAHPEILNDIVSGSNPGCYYAGFSCAVGWDPVTGMGTPNYPKMLQYFMSLP